MNTIEIFVCLMHHAVSIKYEVNRDSYTRFIEATCSQSRVSSSVCLGPIVDTNAEPSKPR